MSLFVSIDSQKQEIIVYYLLIVPLFRYFQVCMVQFVNLDSLQWSLLFSEKIFKELLCFNDFDLFSLIPGEN